MAKELGFLQKVDEGVLGMTRLAVDDCAFGSSHAPSIACKYFHHIVALVCVVFYYIC
jgi:hypothetical protein